MFNTIIGVLTFVGFMFILAASLLYIATKMFDDKPKPRGYHGRPHE